MKRIFLLLVLPLLLYNACDEEDAESEQFKEDVKLIKEYLAENNLVAQSTSSGLYYIIHNEGSGENPLVTSLIDIDYTGKLLNGIIFEDKRDTYLLSGLIKGWQEGIPLIKKSGSITLLIPSKLGYGDKEKGSIPANSVLIFDIELINFF